MKLPGPILAFRLAIPGGAGFHMIDDGYLDYGFIYAAVSLQASAHWQRSEVFVENFIENGRKSIKFTIKFTAKLAKNALLGQALDSTHLMPYKRGLKL